MVRTLVTRLMVLIAYGALLVTPFVSTKLIDTSSPLLPPEPEQEFYNYLEECAKGVPGECGGAYDEILRGSQKVLSNFCCLKFVEKGKKCHDDIVQTGIYVISKDSDVPKPEDIYKTSSHTWNYCASVARESLATAPTY